jgi:YHS domain-containing protein
MERDTFPHQAIVAHSRESFLPRKLQSDQNEQLAAAFGLTAIPATVVVAPNRHVIGFHQGYLGPDEFDAFLSDCLARSPIRAPRQPEAGEKASALHQAAEKNDDREAAAQLALAGYCAVSLVIDRKLVKGQAGHSIEHEGRTYLFANSAARERFKQEPARYRPWSDGQCPVTQSEEKRSLPGEPRWGALYAGQLFVFASESNRKRFLANPDLYAKSEAAGQGESTETAPSAAGDDD